MKILIIYYSFSGNTQMVAEAIARATNATTVKLQERNARSGFVGIVRAVYQTLFSHPSKIRYVDADATQFDLLVLGGPVWMKKITPALRSYIYKEKKRFNQVAFFCTESSSGGARMFKNMQKLCAKHPVATLEVTEADIHSGLYKNKVDTFVNSLYTADKNAKVAVEA